MTRTPFKFLDAYGKADTEIFFGREEEVESLYQMSFQTNLMLVYGVSGTGKTSLVQCGLAGKFESSDLFDITIRRKNNLNDSFAEELKKHDLEKSFEDGFAPDQMIHSLYLDYLRPIYLIFDQFEELFILGSPQEEALFVKTIKKLLAAELPCKIIIVIREEYLGHLSSFEKIVPQIFDKRLRVEPMSRNNARRVIVNTLQNDKIHVTLSNEQVADTIIDKVTEGMGRVQLTYLQVFLDKLYRVAALRGGTEIIFDNELVNDVGRIEDVLRDFLDEQLDVFAQEVDTKELGLKWLKLFVSDKGTKIPIKRQDVERAMPELGRIKHFNYLQFFVNHRILRPLDSDQYELIHDSIALKLSQTKTAGIPMPLQVPAQQLPANPFLNFAPYGPEMAELFFGRDKEIRELFDKVINDTAVRSTLVFGPIGVGKTSLLRAGLIPRVQQLFRTAYLALSREMFDSTLFSELFLGPPNKKEAPRLLELFFGADAASINTEERKILVLDQLEEVFIWVTETVQLEFFYRHLAYLIDGTQNCDLVLVIRDEFFANLQDLESFIPGILEEQMRVKPLDRFSAAEVIRRNLHFAKIDLDNEQVMDRLLQNVTEGDGKINLTFLQLYMHKLLIA
ncbi:MAG: ATP-binding protein [Haliscomenobacter sp.]|uniref:ATP-binding protein n=1 Tax=Haliscomenobacter sp. TaxID=2717303 RepID=UPI0029BBCC48|nr:ATP-binding protein [Haliscomenobacter sp.]MDX2067048.1 ATP-binding protein [Haliscomenobacter sp.]